MFRTVLNARCVVLGVLALVACTPESEDRDRDGNVGSEDLAATAIDNVERALRGTHRAGSFLADSQSLAESLAAMNDQGSDCVNPTCSTPGDCAPAECTPNTITVEDLRESRTDLDESITDFVDSLREEIFTEANLESEDDDSVTFLLGPETLCGTTVDDSGGDEPGDPIPEPQIDPECAESIQKLQPRLKLTSAGDADVDVALLLTAERHNPVTLELHRDRVAVVADLGEIKQTLDAVGEGTGELTTLEGKVSLALARNAELDYSLSANVLEDVVVVGQSDGQPIRVSLGASSPSYEIRLDGNARRITGLVDLGRFSVSGPLNAFREFFDQEEYDDLGNPLPAKTYTGDIELVVPGYEASATYDGTSDKLTFSNFGLGNESSTLKWNGITLAQIDLNASLGRHFDVEVETPTSGGPVLTFSPTFDLTAVLNFSPLADQIEDMASFLLDDTLRVWFDGPKPRVQVSENQFRVVEGTLNFSAASAPTASVSVPAGMCLVEVDPPSASHELLGALGSGACQAQ